MSDCKHTILCAYATGDDLLVFKCYYCDRQIGEPHAPRTRHESELLASVSRFNHLPHARREQFASSIMQKLVSDKSSTYSDKEIATGLPLTDAARCAKYAVINADALIAELNK